MKDFIAFIDVRRHKNWAHKNQLLRISIERLSCQFSWGTEGLVSALHPELLQEVLEISSYSST